jgi:mRNA interferase YafQ
MLTIIERSQFRKDLKRLQRLGRKFDKFKQAIFSLSRNEPLPASFLDHPLKGSLQGCRECHIAPDWLLIYRKKASELFLYPTGSHSELFR